MPTNNLNSLIQLRNETDESADLYIYGDIVSDWWGAWQKEDQYPFSVKNFIQQANGRRINVRINSGGGSVFGGMTIYNLLKSYDGEVVCYIDGEAASIASVIALAGDRVVMRTGSAMMIHKPLYALWGAYNADDFRKMAKDLDEIQKAIMQVYRENVREGVDIDEIERMVNEETWMTSDEAVKWFNVEIETMEAVAVAKSDFIAKFVKNCPPQYAQGHQGQSEEVAAEREKRARDIDILEREVVSHE